MRHETKILYVMFEVLKRSERPAIFQEDYLVFILSFEIRHSMFLLHLSQAILEPQHELYSMLYELCIICVYSMSNSSLCYLHIVLKN
jgi:hypothetical protein